MKKVKYFRKKYPKFIYKKHSYEISENNLEIFFNFLIPPDISFSPKITIKNVNKNQISIIDKETISNLIFNLGLIELLSYWKTTCSPEIIIKARTLGQKQIEWWKDLIIKGMGQFFYENKINFLERRFITIKVDKKLSTFRKTSFVKSTDKIRQDNSILVPIGGGKDSIVTLELLKQSKENITCFGLNPTNAAQKIMRTAKCDFIIAKREIDNRLLKMNQSGFLNGHTPFSAYLAFLTTLISVLFNKKYIAISNERSSNESNLKYLGKDINHQYSKSFDFEEKFRLYSKKYLTKDVEYFSILRPLYEIQVAKLFSRLSEYFPVFISCNEAYKTNSGTKKPSKRWCCNCPKCLFIFVILYPFIKEREIVKIFGENIFEKKTLLPIMKGLIGEDKLKPFECVGTRKESIIAFYLSYKKRKNNIPFLLKYFQDSILPKNPNINKESKNILTAWNNENNLPKYFKNIIKKALNSP